MLFEFLPQVCCVVLVLVFMLSSEVLFEYQYSNHHQYYPGFTDGNNEFDRLDCWLLITEQRRFTGMTPKLHNHAQSFGAPPFCLL